jgi:uncharacterized protein with PIN domain
MQMIFQSDLTVIDDSPKWKMQRFFWVLKNINDFSNCSYCNERPSQVKNAKKIKKFKVMKNANNFLKCSHYNRRLA